MKKITIAATLALATITASTAADKQPPRGAPAPKEIISSDAFSAEVTPAAILNVSNAVADWQIANPYKRADWDWTEGALWTGLTAHAEATGDQKYTDYLKTVSQGLQYKLGPRKGFGDDHCVGQLHLWHYLRDQLPAQIKPTQEILNQYIAIPHDEPLLWVNHIHMREWAWCDALYMAPPTLATLHAATGDIRYLDVMDELYWKTTDYLYNPKEQLYYRDSTFFERKEENGENVYWSRGNGWVFAGLAHILMHMPEDYPSRPKYIKLFQDMAGKLKSLQLKDGSWRPSLLDPESFPSPETSGTAFFAYGFIWGINNGILSEKEYLAPTLKSWDRLVKNVHENGKLGYIQPIGADPRQTTFDDTAVYGVGGFLQLAYELQKHLIIKDSKINTLTLTNPSNKVRLNQTVEIPWATVKAKLPTATAENIAIRDSIRGDFLPIQVIDENKDGTPEALLTTCDFTPSEKRSVQLLSTGKNKPATQPNPTTARFVPERKDDFAWENDRIAFRAYGPALAAENAKAGIDVWTKSVRTPVVNAWYEKGDAFYHKDNGTGLDGYKVGDALGCGGTGFLDAKGTLHTGSVYAKSEVLESGPVRLKFKLTYPTITIGEAKITQQNTITMNTGTHAFHVTAKFRTEGDTKGIRPVAGLATRGEKQNPSTFTGQILAYSDPVMDKDGNGLITTFIINNSDASNGYAKKPNHLLKVLAPDLTQPVNYHAGAIWNKIEHPPELLIYNTNSNILNPIQIN